MTDDGKLLVTDHEREAGRNRQGGRDLPEGKFDDARRLPFDTTCLRYEGRTIHVYIRRGKCGMQGGTF